VPLDLTALVAPARSALLTLEMQNGIVGPEAGDTPVARDVQKRGVANACGLLAAEARAAGVRVVHCIKHERVDGVGAALNTPMWRRRARLGFEPLVPGTRGAALVDELTPEPEDIVSARTRGVTAFGGTELDAVLRVLGIETIVVCGISANVGIFAACVDGVSCGYDVVVVADAIGGSPQAYVQDMLKYSIAPIAVICDSDALIRAWAAATSASA
jgi:nicotinamidase-related amidase